MLLQCGLGAYGLALIHIAAHSLYKAHAFLTAGSTVGAVPRAAIPLATPALTLGVLAGGADRHRGSHRAARAGTRRAGPAVGLRGGARAGARLRTRPRLVGGRRRGHWSLRSVAAAAVGLRGHLRTARRRPAFF